MSLIVVLIFFASIVQSLAGFGYGMVLVPLALLFVKPSLIIPISLITGNILNLILLLQYRRSINKQMAGFLLLGGLLLTPLGVKALISINPDLIKLSVGTIMIFTSIMMYFGLRVLVAKKNIGLFIVGCMSGFIGALCGIGGPPIVLFLVNENIKKEEFKATLILYFSILSLLINAIYFYEGLMTKDVIIKSLFCLPVLGLGLSLGFVLNKHIKEELFKKFVLILVFVSGTLLVVQSL